MKAAALIPVAFFFLIEEQNVVFRAEGKKRLVHMHTKHYHCQLLVFKAPACSSLWLSPLNSPPKRKKGEFRSSENFANHTPVVVWAAGWRVRLNGSVCWHRSQPRNISFWGSKWPKRWKASHMAGGLGNVPSDVTLGAVLCLEALSQVLGVFGIRLCIHGLSSLVYNAV